MSGFPRLFRQFILRALAREKLRSVLAVVGIALGVAVMVAIRLANISVIDSFAAAVDAVSGDADLRIMGRSGPLDERLLRDLVWLEEYGRASPVVENYAMLVEGEPSAAPVAGPLDRGELLFVLGVDVLLDSNMRRYDVLQLSADSTRLTSRQLLDLLIEPDAIILTERFASRHSLRIGDRLRLAFGSEVKSLAVRGLLRDAGPARTMQGNFALMDLAAAQWVSGRLGRLDAVDLQLAPGADLESVRQQIQARLPESLVVEPPTGRTGRTETMVAAFQFNLAALSAIALLVGLFLVYNTIAVNVSVRRDEIGVLMAVGGSRPLVAALFLGEALLLAACGIVCGLPLGKWLASAAVRATAQTVETFYIAAVAETTAATVALPLGDALFVTGVTLLLAFAAALLPAWSAARTDPVSVIRGSDTIAARYSWARPLAVLVCALPAAVLLTRLPPLGGLPVFGFLAELLFLLAAAGATPFLMTGFCRAVGRLARLLRQTTGMLAATNLLAAVPQTSISVAALATSLAMMVAIGVMVGSFRETVVYWLDSVLTADVVVKPVMNSSSLSTATVAPAVADAVRQDPAVETVCWYSSRQIPYESSMIRLDTSELQPLLEYGRILFKSPSNARDEILAGLRSGQPLAIVSESFALRYGKQPGDIVELAASTGTVQLPVVAVYYDYSSNLGTVLVDYDLYQRLFRDEHPRRSPLALSLFLRPGHDPETTRRRLAASMGQGQSLYFVTNDGVRQEALRIFESTFTITYALQSIAIVIAGAGVVSTLLRMIYERRREIGLLGLIGATPAQVRRMVIVEAAMIGLLSQLLGIVSGIVLSLVLIYVINVQSFGWTIQFHVPLALLAQSTLAIVLAAIVFGWFPARRAAAIEPLSVVREL